MQASLTEPTKQGPETARRLGLLALTILLLAYADVVVLEQIYKPLAARHAIPWSELEVVVRHPLGDARCLAWHLAFLPLGVATFLLLGLAGRDPGLAVSGVALFASGWEDAAYYLLLREPIPAELPWLDPQLLVSWTRVLTRTEHLTRGGLVLALVAGALVAGAALRFLRPRRSGP